MKSDNFREVLTLILAFGNYFNYGKRGNALGFKLETLTKICDTRASDNQLNLLVYIVETIEREVRILKNWYLELFKVPKLIYY